MLARSSLPKYEGPKGVGILDRTLTCMSYTTFCVCSILKSCDKLHQHPHHLGVNIRKNHLQPLASPKQVTVFWLLVAALGHDVSHLGVNNQFLAWSPQWDSCAGGLHLLRVGRFINFFLVVMWDQVFFFGKMHPFQSTSCGFFSFNAWTSTICLKLFDLLFYWEIQMVNHIVWCFTLQN